MKNLLLFLFCSFNVFLCVAQQRKDIITVDTAKVLVRYDYVIQQDSIDENSDMICDMVLAIGENSSLFTGEGVFFSNEIIWQSNGKSAIEKVVAVAGKYRRSPLAFFYVLKNYPLNKIMTTRINILGGIKLLVEEPQDLMQWKLHQETKKIGDFQCQKATCHFAGRDYVAWYTMEVPMSEGPYKFNGLPGLIVQIADTKEEHRFNLKSIEKLKEPLPMRFIYEKHKTMKGGMEEYLKALKVWNSGRVFLEEQGLKLSNPEVEKRITRRLKRYNNFIEKPE